MDRKRLYDLILLALVLAFAGGLFLVQRLQPDPEHARLVVRVDGIETASYDMSEDREVVLNGGTNTVKIENGKAWMIEARCPDHLCINKGIISKNGESIICLPNKLSLEIISDGAKEIDDVTG